MAILQKLRKLLGGSGDVKESIAFDPQMVSRAYRVNTNTLQKLQVQFIAEGQVSLLAIADISTTGLGIISRTLPIAPAISETFSLRFLINDVELNTLVEVRRITKDIIGCSYASGESEIREALFNAYHPEIIAASMYKVRSEISTEHPGAHSEWYTGDNNSELYYEMKNDRDLHKLNMSFLGNFFRFPNQGDDSHSAKDSIQYGVSNPDGDVEWQLGIPEDEIEFAKRVLHKLPEMEEKDRDYLLGIFSR